MNMDPFQLLPEDLVREFVLRVPYIFYSNLRSVSTKWKAIIECGEVYKERVRLGSCEKLVCFLDQSGECNRIAFYDPLYNSVAKSPSMPTKFQFTDYSHCLCVGKKLIVMGINYEIKPTKAIMVFDFMSHTWKKGAEVPIQTFGHQIACCSSPEGLVYIAGECQEAAVYDVSEDKWELLPKMEEKIGWGRGYYIDGMFHVVSVWAKSFYRTDRFNPVTQQWDVLYDFELLRYSPLSCVVESGRIYSFAEHNKVMEFDCSRKVWIEACHVPPYLNWVSATELENHVFVTGRTDASPKFELCDDNTWKWVFTDRSRTAPWSYYSSLMIIQI